MGFIVVRPGGTSDYRHQEYTRISRYHGVDIARSPRAHDARMGKRWLPVFADRGRAEVFADELRDVLKDPSWQVVEASTASPDGPLGPILIPMANQSIGLVFGLEPFGKDVLASAYPDAVPALSFAEIRRDDWAVFRSRKGGLDALMREIAPPLTGLSLEQLRTLGYSVFDEKTEETLVAVPPAGIDQPSPPVPAPVAEEVPASV
jgi:hypothetical protein